MESSLIPRYSFCVDVRRDVEQGIVLADRFGGLVWELAGSREPAKTIALLKELSLVATELDRLPLLE